MLPVAEPIRGLRRFGHQRFEARGAGGTLDHEDTSVRACRAARRPSSALGLQAVERVVFQVGDGLPDLAVVAVTCPAGVSSMRTARRSPSLVPRLMWPRAFQTVQHAGQCGGGAHGRAEFVHVPALAVSEIGQRVDLRGGQVQVGELCGEHLQAGGVRPGCSASRACMAIKMKRIRDFNRNLRTIRFPVLPAASETTAATGRRPRHQPGDRAGSGAQPWFKHGQPRPDERVGRSDGHEVFAAEHLLQQELGEQARSSSGNWLR